MRYSCGCRANLTMVSKEQVRNRVCPNHSVEGRERAAKEQRRKSEAEFQHRVTQTYLEAIGMGHMGPLAGDR